MTTYTAPCPFSADSVLEQMYLDICDQFDNGDEIADRMEAKAAPHKARLTELLEALWATFVAEAGLTEEHEEVLAADAAIGLAEETAP